MKALVTGAAGFVGSHLASRLAELGHVVVAIDAMTDYYDVGIKRDRWGRLQAQGIETVEEDLRSADLGSLLADVDAIFHQAGQPGVRASWGAEFRTYTAMNVDATQILLEAARNAPHLRRFVYASSSSVYGDAERYPTSELDLPRPFSPYGVTKLAAEHLCNLYARNFGIPTVSLRYFTVYGPGQRPDMAFSNFCSAAWSGRALRVFGDGEQVRDFTYIADVVDANIAAAEVEVDPGSVFNVCGGTNISVNDTIDLLAGFAGAPLQVDHLPSIQGDVRRTGGDSSAVTDALSWTPRVSIEDGLRAQFESMRPE